MSNHLVLDRRALREIDQRATNEWGVPSIILMENAGHAIADILLSFDIKGLVVICCGKGNNAGDGFVLARHLDNHHIPVHVLLFSHPDELTGDAKINYEILVKSGLFIKYYHQDEIEKDLPTDLSRASFIVDALFGTGLTGQVRAPFDRIIDLINQSGKKILSVDIPSGLDCDTGESMGPVIKADYTVSLVASKKGFNASDAKKLVGKLYVADIGIPNNLIKQYR